MRISSVARLLAGTKSAADYAAEIADELADHARASSLGRPAPVRVSEDADLVLDRRALGTLCRLFADGDLTAAELAYTADLLQMADGVECRGDRIADHLAECTDPEINGRLTVARAHEMAGDPSDA